MTKKDETKEMIREVLQEELGKTAIKKAGNKVEQKLKETDWMDKIIQGAVTTATIEVKDLIRSLFRKRRENY